MNLLRNRTTIVLASVGAIGAIAAIATAASLALFYDPVSPQTASYAAGNVTLNKAATSTCTFDNLAPGYSTTGFPASAGDQSGTACTVDIDYTGSLDAFLALDISVTSTPGSSALDCNGGNASGTATCSGLYNPELSSSETGNADGLQVDVAANGDSYNGENGETQTFGIGNDQTISNPGTVGVDTGYNQHSNIGTPANCNSTTGVDCPVKGGFQFRESFSVYVYWPDDTTNQQNVYQNSSATVTLTEHAVQATDNPLFECGGINDTQPQFSSAASYDNPDQPQEGWGSGFTSGEDGAVPAVGSCPSIDATTNGTDWTSSTPGSELLPFYHPAN